ncbi:MAG: hypothetical protein USCAAHI_02350 [Beijerinckiaceae bacterium]|jgi:hypothetical protein|nr:MAG: hypothetical protein USCAAHI_02350 [Beijerinckiaceae bacterium]
MPELQNMPQAQTGAKLRFETVASHVSVGRPSSRNVYETLHGYRMMRSL